MTDRLHILYEGLSACGSASNGKRKATLKKVHHFKINFLLNVDLLNSLKLPSENMSKRSEIIMW